LKRLQLSLAVHARSRRTPLVKHIPNLFGEIAVYRFYPDSA
jgi:hypothetical protein